MAGMTEGLVLASASTVRAGLLAAAGVYFRIKPAELDEGFLKRACRAEGRAAADCTLALAEAKARQVAGRCGRAVVIRADQLPVCGEVWFDKPAKLGQARSQLQALPHSRACHGSLRGSGRIATTACREQPATDYAAFHRCLPR